MQCRTESERSALQVENSQKSNSECEVFACHGTCCGVNEPLPSDLLPSVMAQLEKDLVFVDVCFCVRSQDVFSQTVMRHAVVG